MSIEQEDQLEEGQSKAAGSGAPEDVVAADGVVAVEGTLVEEASDEAVETGEVLSPEIIALRQQLDAAKAELNQQQEDVLRERAEMQNVRRRTQKEVENARRFALESFANELLPVVDGLERGLEAVPADDPQQQAAREGMSLTLKMLLDVLSKNHVVEVNPVDEVFNPELHQAMTAQPSDEVPPNTVLSVMQKGFTLNGRVLRPALVAVSKKPA